jgi:RNA recognition motif-containing protein
MAAFFSVDPGISYQRLSLLQRNDAGLTCIEELKMETKLYVGNLSYDTTEDSLRNTFAKAGTVVSVDIIKDRDSGRMKGFAFVTMNSDEDAQNAIKILNEKMLDDRAIKVNVAKPREERPQRSNSNYGRGR